MDHLKKISVGKYKISCSEGLPDQNNQVVGIRKDSSKLILKTIFWPAFKLKNYLFVDGFIEREIVGWIKELVTDNTVFLEVGCGDMSLRKFLPKNIGDFAAIALSFALSSSLPRLATNRSALML